MSSVLEPGEVAPPAVPEESAAPVAVAPRPVTPQFIRPICSVCKRPLWTLNGEAFLDDNGYKHDDARLDVEGFPGAHPAELYVEPPVRWGFLQTKGKSDFRVDSGPSKVRSGWSGGGVA